MLLADGPCLDRDERLPRVYRRFACEGKAGCHVSAHEEDPTYKTLSLYIEREVERDVSKKLKHLASKKLLDNGQEIMKSMYTKGIF